MFKMNQLQAAYGLKFADDNEMKLFAEYTDFERGLSEALAEVSSQLEEERTKELETIGFLLEHNQLPLVLAFQENEEAYYREVYLLQAA